MREAGGFSLIARRTATAGVVLLVAGVCIQPLFAIPATDERWIRVDTANFIMFSNAPTDHTVEVGRRLELFRLALSRLNPDMKVNSPLPTFIYVFKDDRSFTPYKKRFLKRSAAQSGYFSADRDGNYVALNATPEGDPFVPVYHEYVHYFLNNNFSNLPLWFNEGLAEFYTTFRVDQGTIEVGRPIAEYVEWLRSHELQPLRRLFAIDTASRSYNERDRQGVFYAQSWALTHYLIMGGPSWGADLSSRLARIDGGEGILPLAGAKSVDELEERLRAYVESGRYRHTLVDFGGLSVKTEVRVVPIDRAEALYRLGDLLMRIASGREEESEEHFREALRVDPAHAGAYAGIGYMMDHREQHALAARYYEKALKIDGENYLTCFLYATSLIDRFFAGVDGPAPLSDSTPRLIASARKWFRESIRLQPTVAEAYAGLGATYAFDAGDVSEGITALEKAREMLPSRPDVVFHLVQLYARIGERDRARELTDSVLTRLADDATVRDAWRTILQGDLAAADRLIQDGRLDEGIEILERALATDMIPENREEIGARIESIRQYQEKSRLIGLYNRAVEFFNRGDYENAAVLFRRVIDEAGDAPIAGEARALLEEIEREAGEEPGPRN